MNPADFWKPWEETTDSFAQAVSFIARVRGPWVNGNRLTVAWRGGGDANATLGGAVST